MPISAGDFRKGVVFEMDGKPMLVVDFQHVKPGKGAAFVRTKYKNVMTGAIREESFNPSAKFENGTVERRNAEYSYNDGDLYYFMDPETYDMTPLNKDVLGDGFQFVKENTMCTLVSYKGSVFSVEAPNFMELHRRGRGPQRRQRRHRLHLRRQLRPLLRRLRCAAHRSALCHQQGFREPC